MDIFWILAILVVGRIVGGWLYRHLWIDLWVGEDEEAKGENEREGKAR